jgi:hypothetical protein
MIATVTVLAWFFWQFGNKQHFFSTSCNAYPNVKCQMPNAKYLMANGKWQMANGKWQMANGKWQMANAKCQMLNAKCQMPMTFSSDSISSYSYGRLKMFASVKRSSLSHRLVNYCSRKFYNIYHRLLNLENDPERCIPLELVSSLKIFF